MDGDGTVRVALSLCFKGLRYIQQYTTKMHDDVLRLDVEAVAQGTNAMRQVEHDAFINGNVGASNVSPVSTATPDLCRFGQVLYDQL